ncbi:hypothetical protein [Amycolatopsis sp. FDAARGOS 1241]|uniref:hypothetical protein n=1 Tax=Amycolatopsis sp. FDAARGOS 1241 TaxID=2778070 RepID=UPI0019517D2C|nr:hypothetical protein [Amycolatopsis sp. FDAARGOS 1241]QRP43222.1 hypothetical protein I6J71_27810 [Amycolatopsis sp. FDAARGOS 1241]
MILALATRRATRPANPPARHRSHNEVVREHHLLGLPVLVAVAALVSALRARRLPAAVAISAGSTPRVGQTPAIQRWPAGTRLPRSVSPGLGMPFTRPAHSALTLAAIVLGVLTVTLSLGVTLSVGAYNSAMWPVHADRVECLAGLKDGSTVPGDVPGPNPRHSVTRALRACRPRRSARCTRSGEPSVVFRAVIRRRWGRRSRRAGGRFPGKSPLRPGS